MKIIICFILIITLLYFSFKMREKFALVSNNIEKGINIDIDKQGFWETKNYSVEQYTENFNVEFDPKILFYKFDKVDSTFTNTPKNNDSLTLGFYLVYQQNHQGSGGAGVTGTTPAVTDTTPAAVTTGAVTTGAVTTGAVTTGAVTTGAVTTTTGNTVVKVLFGFMDEVSTDFEYRAKLNTIEKRTFSITFNSDNQEFNDIKFEIKIINNILRLSISVIVIKEQHWFDFNFTFESINLFLNGNHILTAGKNNHKLTLEIKNEILYIIITEILSLNILFSGFVESVKSVDNFVNYSEGCEGCEGFQSGSGFSGSGSSVDNVLTINGHDTYNFKTIKQMDERYTVTMTNNNNKLINLELNNLDLENVENLGWFLITINKNEIKLSYQYNPYQTATYIQPTSTTVNISNYEFNGISNGNNNRYIGRVKEFNPETLSLEEICKHFYCGKYKCRFNIKDLQDTDVGKWNSLGNDNADRCIKECAMPEYRCNIKQCQEMCIECNTPDYDKWSDTDKNKMCPWLKNIKIDMKEPESPFIRGFPGVTDNSDPNSSSIVIEWKKPYNNMSKITHYLLEVKESLTKYQSHNVITIKHNNCDICEYTIANLKNQTSYDIELSAVNSQGISYKSNKIVITTNGSNTDFLNNMYKDISGDNEEFREYKCVNEFNNSDHILDQVMDEDINIYKHVKEQL